MTDVELDLKKKGIFIFNHKKWENAGMGPTEDYMYDCAVCLERGLEHKIVTEPGPPCKTSHTHAIKGEPTTVRVCTGCGAYDGPWVPATF